MSILIRGASLPKSCNECKLDLRTDICQAFCEWNAEHSYSIMATDRLPDCPLSEAPEPCEDTISRQAAIDAIEDLPNCYNGFSDTYDKACIIGVLEEVPSAQPEIIRCRKCKFASGDSRICMKFGHSPIGELDFCAWAERREE